MGCYLGHGCISNMPIKYGDAIYAIICTIKNCGSSPADYVLVPAAPLISGTYDDYGSIEPDDTPTYRMLCKFFGSSDFCSKLERVTHDCVNQIEDSSCLRALLEKSPERIINRYDGTLQGYLQQNWCMVLEHKSVVDEIIMHGDFEGFKKVYNQDLSIAQAIEIDKHGRQESAINMIKYLRDNPDVSINSFRVLPLGHYTDTGIFSIHCCYRHCENFMYLLTDYAENRKYLVDPEIKEDYLKTAVFFWTCHGENIYMHLLRWAGWQESSNKLWGRMMRAAIKSYNSKN